MRGSVGGNSMFMAQAGALVVLRRRRRGARRLALRGAHLRARRRSRRSAPTASRRRCATSTSRRSRDLLERAGIDDVEPGGVPPLRLGARSSTPSRSTTPGRTDGLGGEGDQGRLDAARRGLAPGPARVVPLRPQRHRRDPARRARGHLRHPRLRREAPPPPLRRPAVPRREHVALPARGLPRALRHDGHAGRAPREEAARAEDPDHDRGHELRRALGAREGGARARRERGRHLDDDRRRRHDARGARPLRACSSTSCCPRATA